MRLKLFILLLLPLIVYTQQFPVLSTKRLQVIPTDSIIKYGDSVTNWRKIDSLYKNYNLFADSSRKSVRVKMRDTSFTLIPFLKFPLYRLGDTLYSQLDTVRYIYPLKKEADSVFIKKSDTNGFKLVTRGGLVYWAQDLDTAGTTVYNSYYADTNLVFHYPLWKSGTVDLYWNDTTRKYTFKYPMYLEGNDIAWVDTLTKYKYGYPLYRKGDTLMWVDTTTKFKTKYPIYRKGDSLAWVDTLTKYKYDYPIYVHGDTLAWVDTSTVNLKVRTPISKVNDTLIWTDTTTKWKPKYPLYRKSPDTLVWLDTTTKWKYKYPLYRKAGDTVVWVDTITRYVLDTTFVITKWDTSVFKRKSDTVTANGYVPLWRFWTLPSGGADSISRPGYASKYYVDTLIKIDSKGDFRNTMIIDKRFNKTASNLFIMPQNVTNPLPIPSINLDSVYNSYNNLSILSRGLGKQWIKLGNYELPYYFYNKSISNTFRIGYPVMEYALGNNNIGIGSTIGNSIRDSAISGGTGSSYSGNNILIGFNLLGSLTNYYTNYPINYNVITGSQHTYWSGGIPSYSKYPNGYYVGNSFYGYEAGGGLKDSIEYCTIMGFSSAYQLMSNIKYVTIVGAMAGSPYYYNPFRNLQYSTLLGYGATTISSHVMKLGADGIAGNYGRISVLIGTDTLFNGARFIVSGKGYFSDTVWATTFIPLSDKGQKKNIDTITTQTGIDKIIKLKGKTYEFNKQLGKKSAGLIAQEVEEIIPEAVITYRHIVKTDSVGVDTAWNDTNNKKKGFNIRVISRDSIETVKGIDYNALIPYLVESIKQLNKEIIDLKKRIK